MSTGPGHSDNSESGGGAPQSGLEVGSQFGLVVGESDRALRVAEVDARIGLLAAQVHAVQTELVTALAEHDALRGWQDGGFRSHGQWISMRTKFTPHEARQMAALVPRVGGMTSLLAEGRAGRVSVGLLAAAARVVTVDNEAAVIDVVRCCTDSQGRHRVDAALDSVTGALLDEARRAAQAHAERSAGGDDRHTRVSSDETTAELASLALAAANGAGVRSGGDRFLVQVECDLATLAGVLGLAFDPSVPVGLGSRAYWCASGRHLSDTELTTVVAEAGLQLLLTHDGAPVWMGNRVRLFNGHQRRAFGHRSARRCEFPGCDQSRFVHAHHVVEVADGGRTDLDNGVLLCGHHHRQLHRRGWRIVRSGSKLTFFEGDRCLGSSGPPGGKPVESPAGDGMVLPLVTALPAPADGIEPDTPLSEGRGERLTHWGMDILVGKLLAA